MSRPKFGIRDALICGEVAMMITAFALAISACLIPKWSVVTVNGNNIEVGIWEICTNGNCVDWNTSDGLGCYAWVGATAAFSIISICALFIGVVFALILLLCIKLVPQLIAGCMFYFGIWAAIACLICWIMWWVFANQDWDNCVLAAGQKLENYNISFWMQVVASVLAGIASCLACCTCCVGGSGWGPGKKKSKDDDGPYGTDNEMDEKHEYPSGNLQYPTAEA